MIFENKKHYIIATNCVIVDGACRSLIYDLQRGDYEIITNELSAALAGCKSNSFEELFNFLPEEDEEFYTELLTHLVSVDIIIPMEEEEISLFPMMSFNWDYPNKFSNAIIEYSKSSPFSLVEAIAKIDKLGLSGVEVRLTEAHEIDFFRKIAHNVNETGLKHIDFLIKYADGHNESFLYELKGLHPTSFLITQYESPVEQIVNNVLGNYIGIQRTPRKYEDLVLDQKVKSKNFVINRNFFLESQNYNPYFNGKIFVLRDGEIYDNVNGHKVGLTIKSEIAEIVQSSKIMRYWHARKDDTKVCRDCEFRYMCLDTRTPIKNNTGWEHSNSCQYNPYTVNWRKDEIPVI